jgi:predicted alpha/beta-hydrolase family hydrolase
MKHWVRLLRKIGKVQTLDYPYMIQGRKRPDRLPILIAAHQAALARVRKRHQGSVVLIGKSMGSRVGCHVALEEKVDRIVCLGYPLCGMGDPKKMRDEVLLRLTTPILFVQGTRDSLCPLNLLASVRAHMKASSQVVIVPGGDHSLAVTKRQLKNDGETQTDVEQRIVRIIEAFVRVRVKIAVTNQ